MKIQLSPIRIVPDALVVWNEHGPEVDIVMDLKKLTFKPGSVDEIYAFHVLEHFFLSEIVEALQNWRDCVGPGKEIYLISDDFEFLSRLFVGGEINIDEFNKRFSYPTKLTQDNLVRFLKEVGYPENEIRKWYVDVPNLFKKQDFELVVSAKKI